MTQMEGNSSEGVFGRKLVFCDRLQEFDTDELVLTCGDCRDYFLFCCHHSQHHDSSDSNGDGGDGDDDDDDNDNNDDDDDANDNDRICHHFRLIFTDGACSRNGQSGAVSGIGIAIGDSPDSQKAIPITMTIDGHHPRTNQRAELLAALQGLDYVADKDESNVDFAEKSLKAHMARRTWIIATDSVYVVKGITEWFPTWKRKNFRTVQNKKPANLDLFLELDAAITARKKLENVNIGFWHVPREYNTVADALAKKAAQDGDE
ncbi:uncharacterized protein KY384_007565 [Bacidia gigantensis]|uniref:uncharacterized protein n=1 Tax=Bacidia gigantensis TaxID=2732470 RepID=UPI001D040312|nr:uncharacterized protein KY384_007565 [Bacidia gigantensis]KAG8527413.1 hypothetical protein KY384_007565 [Bacidia gigantensis]